MPTILIIDDRTDSWDSLENNLSKPQFANYRVIGKLLDGQGLKNYFNSQGDPPDLVFLDKTFSGNRNVGEIIAGEIKSLNPLTKIILMTEFKDRLDFINLHSSGFLDGYIRKDNIRDSHTLQHVMSAAFIGDPYWDVPKDWLQYELKDDPEKLKFIFAQKRGLDPDQINYEDEEFREFRQDEKIRREVQLTNTEWEIFKRLALCQDNKEIKEGLKITEQALHAHMLNIREKLDIPYIAHCDQVRNKNKGWFVVEGIKLRIPEVVANVSTWTNADIRFPD